MAENEAYKQEQDYLREQYNNTPSYRSLASRSQSAAGNYGKIVNSVGDCYNNLMWFEFLL